MKALVYCLALCALLSHPARAADIYNAADTAIAGEPGTLIQQEPIAGAPQGATAWRILYRSRSEDGKAIPVSALVVVPRGSPPVGGRPVVAWAHPTTGVVPACAPSRSPLRFLMMPGLSDALKAGFIVTATDYPGTGTDQVQPFLDGGAEGRAVLDSVRAAATLPGTDASRQFALWGHSQGGQAVIFAANLHQRYAPELKLAGLAAAAPATDLATLFRDDLGSRGGNNLTALALWAWGKTQNAPYDRIVAPGALGAVDAVAAKCIDTILPSSTKRRADKVLGQQFLTVPDVTVVQPWQTIIARNTAGTLPPALPVFLAQGGADIIVHPAVTAAYMARLCKAGSKVQLHNPPDIGHGWIASRSSDLAMAWIADRFAGKPAPNSCGAG